MAEIIQRMNSWATFCGPGVVFKPPPPPPPPPPTTPEIPKAHQNRAKLNPIVKTVKN